MKTRHPQRSLLWAGVAGVWIAAAAAVVAQAPAADKPAEQKPRWESSAEAGLTLTEGNSESILATGRILTGKKWDKNELGFGLDGAYGKTRDQGTGVYTKNAETLHGFGQYNRLFSEQVFGYARADGYHDAVAGIDYRFTLSPGAGYYFIKNKTTLLSGEAGPGYVWERKGGVTDDYVTLRLAQRFEHKFNDRVRVWESLEYLPQVDMFDNYVLNAEIGVESALSKRLSLRVYLQDSYTSMPAPGREKNDLKLIAALAVKF